jgi:activator of 2-hydroxyglutaryl-CoA dehydratase
MGSVKIRSPKKLAPLVETLLRAEMHIIAAMGIDDGSTNFRQVFSDMGIPANWILTPQNNPSEIRKAFAFASQSAVRASQAAGGAGFSQVAAGGFGAP